MLDVQVESHSGCAVMLDGTLQCFGNGITWGEPAPAGVAFVEVGVGRNSACGREADGTVRCWGRDQSGIPFPDAPAGSFADLEAYNQVACALDTAGNPQCWWSSVHEPYVVPQEQFSQISLGEWVGCGVTLDGRAVCWGDDSGLGETIVPAIVR